MAFQFGEPRKSTFAGTAPRNVGAARCLFFVGAEGCLPAGSDPLKNCGDVREANRDDVASSWLMVTDEEVKSAGETPAVRKEMLLTQRCELRSFRL